MTRTTEKLNPRSRGIDAKTVPEILEIINREDSGVADAVGAQLAEIGEAVENVASTIRGGGRVFLVGAGTSGRLCVLEAAEIPPTYGLPAERFQAVIAGGRGAVFKSVEAAEDDAERVCEELAGVGLSEGDLLVGVTASGSTPHVLGAVEYARSLGVHTVGISCNSGSPLSGLVDVAVEAVVGPEVVAGSTRMKAGTSQKMVLNMITTAAMVRLGLVHDGYMVGVQASSDKLMERGRRMIAEIAGVDVDTAGGLLSEAGGDVRAAVLLGLTDMTLEEAKAALGGWRSLRDVLKSRGVDA
ncbi:N-acetylmuramic acid 6-phosphate etherase [Candidatus Bathyarchaeota archaeon]|nr:N-acetylmuramic acid 6-phosphate etherase [Candidatus Bathyarchaeota archaeon]